MNYLSTDHMIVYASLLLTLITGLWAGRGIKTIREYALANKMFGTGVLTMTILATYIGGWNIIGFPGDIFADGMTHVVPTVLCGVVVCLLFIAIFIAPKIGYFDDCITMGDLMQKFYGRHGGIITGILGLIYSTTAVSIQLLFLGQVCELLGIRWDYGLLISAVIVVIYSSIGGMKAVTITDVIQFIVIVVSIPLVANMVLYQAGGMKALLSKISSEKLHLFSFGQEKIGAYGAEYYSFPILALWYLFPGFPLSFPFIQRMLMVKNRQQATNMYYISTIFLVVFFLLLTLIGLSALILYPALHSKEVVPHIISQLPGGVQGVMIAGLVAVIMSSADSFLHAAGLSFTHDFVKPFFDKSKKPLNELNIVKYSTFLIGCLSITMALAIKDIFKIAIYGMDLAALLFTIPLIAGIMGLKTDISSFLTSIIITLLSFTLTQLYLNEDLGIPICILANAISFFGTHLIKNKGFLISNRATGKAHLWKPRRESIFARIKQLLDIVDYSQRKVAKYGTEPTTFALFFSFSCMVPFFMHMGVNSPSLGWVLIIRGIGAILCVGLLLRHYWPAWFTKYFPIYWHVSLLYCLPLTNTIMFLLNDSPIEWIVNIALSIILLIVLTDWVTFVVLSLGGVGLGLLFYKYFISPLPVTFDRDTIYTLGYTCLFTTLIGLLFARRKQQNFDLLEEQKQQLLTTQKASAQDRLHTLQYQHYLKTSLERSTEPLGFTKKALKSLAEKVPADKETAQKAIDQIEGFVRHYKNTFYYTMDFLRLQVKELSLENLLDKLYRTLEKEGMQEQVLFQVQSQQKNLACDPDKITQLLAIDIRTLHKQAPRGSTIQLQVQDTQLAYQFKAVPNQTRALAALAFTLTTDNKVATPKTYYQGNTKEPTITIPANLSQLPERDNVRIIDAHYGYSQSTDSLILHVIPVKLRDIRPKVADELPVATQEAPLDNAASIKQEKDLLTALKSKTKMDIGLAKEVIRQIKQWHQGQRRKSGDLFYTHPMTVALLLLELTQDPEAIVAALLHDAVEDTLVTLEEVQYKYGKTVAYIVDKVTHLDQTFKKAKLTERENQLQLAAQQDPRVIMVKLADRLHNMRTIQFHPPNKQKDIAKETLSFYVPLGRILGLPAVDKVVDEIEKRCQALLAN